MPPHKLAFLRQRIYYFNKKLAACQKYFCIISKMFVEILLLFAISPTQKRPFGALLKFYLPAGGICAAPERGGGV